MSRILVSDAIRVQNGFAFKSELFSERRVGLPVARIRDVVRGYSETYYTGSYLKEYEIGNGDLLIGMDGEFNVGVWQGGRALLNQRVCKIIPKNGIADKQYLKHRLALLVREIEAATPYVTVKHLSSEKLKAEEIELPPLLEQKRIAALLEKTDLLRRTRRYARQLSDTFLHSVFLEMFGDPRMNPMGWDKFLVDDVLTWSQYGTSQKSNTERRGYPVLGMGNITTQGQIDLSSIGFVDLTTDEFRKLKLESGDIIFNRTNSTELVGKTACWRLHIDAVVASYLVRLRLNSNVVPEFFAALLNSAYFKKLFQDRCKKAVGQSNISPTLLREFPIYVPPLPLQHKFADIVRRFERLRAQQREAERQAEHLFQTLLHRAFAEGGL